MRWNKENDTFSIQTGNDTENPSTKRGILKEISKVFDPMGFCSAALLRAKLLLQSLWKKSASWDGPLSEEDEQMWQKIKKDMQGIEGIQIPRFISGSH